MKTEKRDSAENYQKATEAYPYIYQIEITENCNLKCPACYRTHREGYKSETITLDLINKIVDNGYLVNTPYTELQMSGEPLLVRHIDRIIKKIKSVDVMIGMSTNGSIVTDQAINTINTLDCLTISTDSFIQEHYERSRFPQKFDKFKHNLEIILNKINPKSLVYIQLLKTQYTDEFEESVKRLKDFLSSHNLDKPNVFIRHVDDCFDNMINGTNNNVDSEICINPFTSASIKADGTIVPCCYDFSKRIPLGNLHKQTLSEIWEGRAYTRLRESFINNDRHEMCKECPYKSPMKMMYIFSNDLIKHKMRLMK